MSRLYYGGYKTIEAWSLLILQVELSHMLSLFSYSFHKKLPRDLFLKYMYSTLLTHIFFLQNWCSASLCT